jgi:hypothetical protein
MSAIQGFLVLPASRKPITTSTTKEDYKHDDDNYGTHVLTLVLLVSVSHTFIHEQALHSGITKERVGCSVDLLKQADWYEQSNEYSSSSFGISGDRAVSHWWPGVSPHQISHPNYEFDLS